MAACHTPLRVQQWHVVAFPTPFPAQQWGLAAFPTPFPVRQWAVAALPATAIHFAVSQPAGSWIRHLRNCWGIEPTTMIYTHCLEPRWRGVRSRADNLETCRLIPVGASHSGRVSGLVSDRDPRTSGGST